MVGKTTAAHRLLNTLWWGDYKRWEHRGNDLLWLLFLRHTRRLQRGGNYLSLSLSRSVQLLFTRITTTFNINIESMCPKSYLYIYDFSAYLHMCPSNQSEPIGTGSWISRFSVSSIRRDMFPNILLLHEIAALPNVNIYPLVNLLSVWLPAQLAFVYTSSFMSKSAL